MSASSTELFICRRLGSFVSFSDRNTFYPTKSNVFRSVANLS